MASIAYITDRTMLEFHRLNGSTTMNFWRLESSKQFKDFKEGDLLFFLTKCDSKKEKGILGYGRLVKQGNMSIKKMWDVYGSQNGYRSLERFQEGITKILKQERLPKKLNSLYLTHVVFFQSPIYPSELGLEISNKLESFVYLDRQDSQITFKILQKAKENGIDLWSSLEHEVSHDVIEHEEVRVAILNSFKEIKALTYLEENPSGLKKVIKQYQLDHPDFIAMKGNPYLLYRYQEGKITFVLAHTIKDLHDRNVQLVLGYLQLFQYYMKQYCPYSVLMEYVLLPENSELLKIVEHIR